MTRVHDALLRARATSAGAESATPEPDQAGVPLFLPGEETLDVSAASEPASMDVIEAVPEAADDTEVLLEPPRRLGEKLVLAAEPDHVSVEQYRRLGARLHLAQAESGMKVVMIASALAGEGKTLTAANLALTLSESYERDVLLIDGDLRRPSVHELFRIQNVAGLNDGLRAERDRKVPLVRWSEHLTLITAGRPEPDPMKVLVSEKMQRVIGEASRRFDWVVIDTPPVGLLTDASLFSAMVDTVVLVIEAGRTPYADVQRTIQVLGRDRIFGVVLNRVAQHVHAGYYYGSGYNYGTALQSR